MRLRLILPLILLLIPVHALKVGVYDNPPLVYVEDGNARGFYVDILASIAQNYGWELEYVYDTFPNLLEKLKSGEIDLLTAVAFTEERAKLFKFNNESVLVNWGVVVSRDKLDSILSLKNLRIAGVKGDVYFEQLKTIARNFEVSCTFIDVVGDYKDVMQMIANGEADAGVVSRIYASLYSSQYDLVVSSIIFGPVNLKFAGRSSEILSAIDEQLSQMKQDPNSAYHQALERWFGSVGSSFVIPSWVYAAMAILAFTIVAFLVLTTYLSEEIERRTKRLREREKFLVAVFNAIQDGISVLDTKLNVLMINHAMEKWYGNVVGKKCYEAYHGRKEVCENCPSIKAIESGKLEHGIVKGPGGKGWVELYCYPVIENGKATMVVEFVRDITEKLRVQEELERTLRRYEYLWKNSSDILYIHDLSGKFIDYNPRVLEITGGAKVETIWEVIPESKHEFVRNIIEEIVRRREPIGFELPVSYGGKKLWLEVIAHPLVENGEVVAIHGVARDVTQRIELMEEISENIKLVAYLVDRIRNPLAAARAFCELKEKVGEEVFEKIIDNIDRVTALISDLDKLWENLERLRSGLRKS